MQTQERTIFVVEADDTTRQKKKSNPLSNSFKQGDADRPFTSAAFKFSAFVHKLPPSAENHQG